VLEETIILPDPPLLIATVPACGRFEALNLGTFDVLAKPFERTETTRVFESALRALGRARTRPAHRQRSALKASAYHAS